MLVRLIIWLLVGFLIYTLYRFIRQALSPPAAPPPASASRGEEMVQDPECGTYLPRSEAIKVQAGGMARYFCSTGCRDKFRERG